MPLTSNLVQPLNFVLFDILLISAVYHLTSDIGGRLNDLSLRNGRPQRLLISCPPLIGGGLVSTRRVHVTTLLFIRVVGLALILVSELTIEGNSRDVLRPTQAQVVAPGAILNFTLDDYQRSVIRRTGCLGTVDGRMYYGRIMNRQCVLDVDRVHKDAVKLDLELVIRNMSLGRIERERVREGRKFPIKEFYCENGLMQCEIIRGFLLKEACRGVIHYNGTTYIADNGALWPNMPVEPTEARIIENHDWRDDRWFDAALLDIFPVVDSIHAVYGAANQNLTVNEKVSVNQTDISLFWFVALGAKVFLVLILGVVSFVLWRYGCRVVMNDEQGLTDLVRRNIEDNDPRLTRVGEPQIFLKAVRSEHNRGRLRVVASGRPGYTNLYNSTEKYENLDNPFVNYTADSVNTPHVFL